MEQSQISVKNMERSTKKEIRAIVKKNRREATPEQIRENSNEICKQFLNLPEYKCSFH